MTEIAQRIIAARHNTTPSMKQRELAKAIGCSPPYITMLEKGRSIPSPAIAIKLEHALGLAPGTLLQLVLQTKLRAQQKPMHASVASGLLRGMEAMPSHPDLVMKWTTDANHRVVYLSEDWAEFTGRSTTRQLGMGWTDEIHPDDFSEVLRKRAEAFKARVPFVITYRLRSRDGHYYLVVDSATPRYNTAGDFDGYAGACVVSDEQRIGER